MGDEHIGQAVLVLKVLKQVEHLRAYGHIQGGYRLVADDQLGSAAPVPGLCPPSAACPRLARADTPP